jgi:hypothetical protein
MTRAEVSALISIEPVLRRLGLSLYCVRCHGRGQKDGIRAANDPSDKEWVVECGCCERIYHRDIVEKPPS